MAGREDSIAVRNVLEGYLNADNNAIASSVGTAYNPTYALVSEAGAQIILFINNADYKMYAQLKDKNGNLLYTSNIIDLPLESVVMNGRYDSTTKEVVLTLVNGNEIRFSVEDLVRGLVDEDQLEETLSGYWSKEDLTEEDIENWNNKQDYLNQGENIQIYSDLNLKGNIEQDSTTGKNLLPSTLTSQTLNQVQITKNSDGSVKLNGTNNASTDFKWFEGSLTLPAGTYYIGLGTTSNKFNLYYITGGNPVVIGNPASNSYYTLTLSQETTITRISSYTSSTKTFSNETYYPMICKELPFDYEIYTNGASPNPSYPQDIHIVSGDNEIKVCNKNLFDKNSVVGGFVNADGSIGGDTNAYRTSDFIPIQPNTTYYKTSTESPRTKYYDINKQPLNTTTYQDISIGGNAGTFTTPNNVFYLRFSYPIASVDDSTIQIEKGNQATDYVEHKEYTKEINLPVENLFNINNANIVTNRYLDTSGIEKSDGSFSISDYIKVSPNTDYSMTPFQGVSACLCYYDNSKTFISSIGRYKINPTFTTPNNCYYIRTSFRKNEISDIQIEKGTKANSYTPYGTTPIEVGSIGDYKDEFFKNTINSKYYNHTLELNKWYLKKNIGKYIFTGDETPSTITGGYFYLVNSLSNMSYIIGGYNTKFQFVNDDRIINNGSANDYLSNNQMAFRLGSGKDRLYIKTQLGSSDLKSALTDTPLYYVLATPENILLNNTLQEQLDGLSANLSDKEMINIIQDNNDLPFIINYNNTKLTIDVPCAGADQGGVIKTSDSYATATADGVLTSQTKTYAQYNSLDNNAFVSKGTLKNVLDKYIGDIDTALDAINGEVI